MPAYGKVKVDTITYDLSGTATDVSVSNIATKASPTFTGTVTVPTASANDNTTKAASTAYVQTELGDYALKAGPTFTGTVNAADLVLSGDLTVNGTTTTIDTTTLQVEDKNIEIGKVSTPSDVTADGGGWTLKGATDKTFNWVNATDAWTSSEHIHLGDNKKLLVGTGSDLEIFHDGNNSHIRDTGTGSLFVKASTFYVNSPSAEDMITATADGAVTLYHDNSAKLATSSSGCTVTGTLAATAVTGDGSGLTNLPPGGNTFTAVADGALATNKPVKINSNGKVSEIKTSLGAGSLSVPTAQNIEPSADEHYSGANTGDPTQSATVYDPNSNKVLHLWHGPSNYIHYKIGTINTSTGAITWQGVHTGSHNFSRIADSTSITGRFSVAACWHPTRNRVVCVYSSNTTYKAIMYFADISSANGTTTPTWSGPHTISTTNTQNRIYIEHDPDADRLVFSYQASDENAYIKVIDVASDLSITQGTEVQINNSGSGSDYYGKMPTICYDTNRNKWSILYHDGGTRDLRGKVGTVTASGNSISLSSQVVLDTGENRAITQVFDPNTNKICIVHRTSNTFYARLGEISSSGTLSVGTKVTMSGQSGSSDVGESDYGPGRVAMVYLPYSSKVVGIVPVSDGGISDNPKYVEWTTTGSTPSIAQINAPSTVLEQKHTKWPWVGVAINTGMVCWTIGTRSSSSYNGDNRPRQITTSVVAITTNLSQASDVVGWPKQAYSDGDTATILCDGNVKSGLSGLTIGSDYYINQNGSIATSDDFTSGFLSNTPYAGRAIASDKIIIGHPMVMNGT